MYKKVDTDLNFVEREKEVARFWKENDIFKKSVDCRKDGPVYTFYDGPPTANGKPHIGHVETRVIKDMIPRYRAMKGCYVPRKAGWDTHGLPVELTVEKELGLSGKEQIEEYGMDPFIRKCRESVWKYKEMWEKFSEQVGFWADMDDPYVTYEDNYIESVWWALTEIWRRGLLYRGFKVVPYCPRCGTPLSTHEVAQGYKEVKEKSAVVRFKVTGEDAYFLAWTTTPWTLPSNVALCVNPDETYVKVKASDGFTYYLAEALADKLLNTEAEEGEEAKPGYTVLETFKGVDLKGRDYEPLWQCTADSVDRQGRRGHYIVCDNYVTMTDGTGIVHIAPAFGEDDARIGREYELPFVQFVDGEGKLTEETPFAGLFVKDADPEVLKDLEDRKLLFSAPEFTHDYPFCWRCSTPLIYYARQSWFIKTTEVRDELVENNKTVNWVPPSIGEGRFGNWLENIQDWAISRDRYWGTPLNIWNCPECHIDVSIGSREDLYKRSGDERAKTVELHRPYIDEIKIHCPQCGGDMTRVPEVIDCWFDSGAMPFAQYHYPFENKELFERQFPASFISEAVDQTRGWFYSLMAESTLLFEKSPYENCIVMGLVLDGEGQKMSKSKGNAVDPMEALDTYGADAIRWYFYISSAPWLPKRFHGKAVQEGQRKFLGTLWNTYAFYVLYADIDSFDPTKYSLDIESLSVMDKWLLSKLNSAVKAVDSCLDQYKIPEAANALYDFVDQMSNWYVRRCRERFWAKGMEQDKINAYMTLWTALETISRAAAPMIPFMTEQIYQNIVRTVDQNAPESIHLCDFPEGDDKLIDTELEKNMDDVLNIVVLGRAARNTANTKNRQPLRSMYVKADCDLPGFFVDIIKEELNVKEVVFRDDISDLTSYSVKPQLRTVGPKYGKLLGGIREHLKDADGSEIVRKVKSAGEYVFTVDGSEVVLTEEDMLIDVSEKEGFVTEENSDKAVVLDTNLDEALIEEGFVAELISKIQTMRKDAGFEVMDRINVTVSGNKKLYGIAQDNSEFISGKVLADSITDGDSGEFRKEWDINGETALIGVSKV
ncbi:MAG: isoleucine--tRNA ligase [Lachnospiraceae bacterium]|nr:isoleucine--tRNA ligase [Lachnospiraceae bacterium]